MNEVKAAKHLGQHFLRDEAVIARLLAVINAKAGERILEIGPGLGALTLPLLRQIGALTAVEYDPRVLAPLTKKAAPLGALNLIHADILTINFGELLAKQPPPPVGEGRGGGSDQPASATSTPPSPRAGGTGSGVHPHTAAAESAATHRVRLGAPQAAEIITAPHSPADSPPPPQNDTPLPPWGRGRGWGLPAYRVAESGNDQPAATTEAPQKLRLVGNLPYNLSSPILFHCLAQRQHIHDMHYMLQKEVVDRITAAPGSKTYGRLSLMAQLWCETTALFDIPPDAFDPPPKVDSAVVRLVPRPAPAWQIDDLATFDETVRLAFAQRRKMLRKTFAHWMNAAALEALDIDPTARAETLDGAAFARLANAHYQQERQK